MNRYEAIRELQKLIDELTKRDNKIDGVVLLSSNGRPIIESQALGYGGAQIDPQIATLLNRQVVGATTKVALQMPDSGRLEGSILTFERAIWSIFVLREKLRDEYIVAFYARETSGLEALQNLSEHVDNALRYLLGNRGNNLSSLIEAYDRTI